MTYLEEYLKERNITEEYFWKHEQEDCDGFCPRDIGLDYCTGMGCKDCWKREIND